VTAVIKVPVMTRRGIIMCDIGTEGYAVLPDWVENPSDDNAIRGDIEYAAGLIVERDKLQKQNKGLQNAVKDKDEQRRRAVELNQQYKEQLEEANNKLEWWRRMEASRRNQLQVQGLFG